MTRNEKIIWAAGFFDGEGYIGINEKKKGRFLNLVVSVGQVDKNPLEILNDLFGGHFGKQVITSAGWRGNNVPYKKIYHHWVVEAKLAAKFLREILPYLINKKSQAEMAVQFQMLKSNRGVGLTDFERAEQESFNEAFRDYRWAIHDQESI